MSQKTERTQVLLTPEQRRRVERVAEQRGVSMGAVIRQAVDAYVGAATQRTEAMERLFSLDAPVDDWSRMKREIIEGAST